MTFRVGQKVVCVLPNEKQHRKWGRDYPDYLGVYTVRRIVCGYGDPFLLLREVKNPIVSLQYAGKYVGRGEQGFGAKYFRPVQEQGMSILRSIAANPKQKIREDA